MSQFSLVAKGETPGAVASAPNHSHAISTFETSVAQRSATAASGSKQKGFNIAFNIQSRTVRAMGKGVATATFVNRSPLGRMATAISSRTLDRLGFVSMNSTRRLIALPPVIYALATFAGCSSDSESPSTSSSTSSAGSGGYAGQGGIGGNGAAGVGGGGGRCGEATACLADGTECEGPAHCQCNCCSGGHLQMGGGIGGGMVIPVTFVCR